VTRRNVTLTVNQQERAGAAEDRTLLSDFIRDELGLTGTHVGCEHGVCGACTVLMDGLPIRSCLVFAVQAQGSEILTVEGLAEGSGLNPLQSAFRAEHALQCGFCTPGFLMTATWLMRQEPRPTGEALRDALSGNLCRCTGYANIVRACEAAFLETEDKADVRL
jgi:carbon-monoxide dehydrogenase small subunit